MKDRLRELRKSLINEEGKRFTQQDMADALGLVKGTVTAYETGNRYPNDAVIKLICEKFDVDEGWLRFGIEPEEPKAPEKKKLSMAEYASILDESTDPNDDLIKYIVEAWVELDPKSREALNKIAHSLAEKVRSPEK